ncbi:MAG: hypothetical protein AAF791_15000, partial [Bacteroidota bacterium]
MIELMPRDTILGRDSKGWYIKLFFVFRSYVNYAMFKLSFDSGVSIMPPEQEKYARTGAGLKGPVINLRGRHTVLSENRRTVRFSLSAPITPYNNTVVSRMFRISFDNKYVIPNKISFTYNSVDIAGMKVIPSTRITGYKMDIDNLENILLIPIKDQGNINLFYFSGGEKDVEYDFNTVLPLLPLFQKMK